MSVTLQITVSGGEHVARVLDRLSMVSAAPFRAVGEQIAANLERQVAETFRTQSQGRWAPLSPKTVRARLRRWGYYAAAPGAGVGPERPVLEWQGILARSFQRGQAGHVEEIEDRQMTWGSEDPKAGYHQPTRPMLRLDDLLAEPAIVLDPIETALREAAAS